MGKRANGEGSIFRRADGLWAAELSYTVDGRPRRRTVYGRTQSAVRAKLRDARARLDAGEPLRDTDITLRAWLTTWTTTTLAASDRKQSTRDLYTIIARTHLVPALGEQTLAQLRPSHIEALIADRRAAGLSASTVRTIYTVLRAALDVAVRDGLLRRNPATAVPRPTAERTEASYLTAEQAQRLLDVIRGDRLEAFYRLLLATGLRRGEALALHWADIDLHQATLRVRWTLTRTSQGLALGTPKTDRSRRTVPLPQAAVTALRAHQAGQHAERQALGPVWQDHDLVFTTEIGTPLEPRNVARRFAAHAHAAGLPKATLHTLRHTAASLLLATGTHTKIVQEHLGHSSYAITADIYSHVTPTQAREAATRLDQALHW